VVTLGLCVPGFSAWQCVSPARQRTGVAVKGSKAEVGLRLKGQTLRLKSESWLKLKLLAAILDAKRGVRVTQHDLLLEAVDDLLAKHRKELPRNDN